MLDFSGRSLLVLFPLSFYILASAYGGRTWFCSESVHDVLGCLVPGLCVVLGLGLALCALDWYSRMPDTMPHEEKQKAIDFFGRAFMIANWQYLMYGVAVSLVLELVHQAVCVL